MEKELTSLKEQILKIYDHLHTHPEPSWKEYATTQYLSEILQREGFETKTFAEHTGVIGEKGKGGPVVGLRADMDALWQEVEGKWQANHSCGHDAHMTIVMGTVLLLNRMGYEPTGRLKVIFQPAEEQGTGALKFIEQGVIADLEYLYGVHLRPIQELTSGQASPATLHGAGKFIQGQIKGRAAHAARPHLGINVIEVGASLVKELAQVHTDPQIPASIKMTRFIAGDKGSNVIPANAEFSVDIRTQTNAAMTQILDKLPSIFKGVAEIYGAEVEWQVTADTVAGELDETATGILQHAVEKVLGVDGTMPPLVTPGGEDFHHYRHGKPTLHATMLGLGCNLSPGLHHPQMSFDRMEIFNGIKILTSAVIETFGKVQGKE
ncbi:MAG TPA: M20 peptidase aminoacylase family protein [Candidatus Deferrimicrobium sp.]|nr:M20 peptidase aminoacylase family protein [Candidatus Deferrimicrobium sp.]